MCPKDIFHAILRDIAAYAAGVDDAYGIIRQYPQMFYIEYCAAIAYNELQDFHSKPSCPALAPLRMKQGQAESLYFFCRKDEL